jgi:hypothetical protein
MGGGSSPCCINRRSRRHRCGASGDHGRTPAEVTNKFELGEGAAQRVRRRHCCRLIALLRIGTVPRGHLGEIHYRCRIVILKQFDESPCPLYCAGSFQSLFYCVKLLRIKCNVAYVHPSNEIHLSSLRATDADAGSHEAESHETWCTAGGGRRKRGV